jgi:hypothetical protein
MLGPPSSKELPIFYQALFALFILTLGLSPVCAEPPLPPHPGTTASGSSWILSAGGAVDFPHSNWNPDYRIGIGSGAEVSVPLAPDWTAGLGLGYFHYQGNDSNGPILIDEIRVLPMARFYPMEGNVSPYLTGGAGLAVQFAAAQGKIAGSLNPDGFLGMGMEIHLKAQEAFFLGTNYSLMIAGDVLAQDVEAVAGLRCGF